MATLLELAESAKVEEFSFWLTLVDKDDDAGINVEVGLYLGANWNWGENFAVEDDACDWERFSCCCLFFLIPEDYDYLKKHPHNDLKIVRNNAKRKSIDKINTYDNLKLIFLWFTILLIVMGICILIYK